jgi:tetratricopeptide (TPR) repeat protein
VLLVLDNAADAGQVRPLLPGSPGALVLVSSRRYLLALEGAVPVSLDVLPRDGATALFRRIAGAHRLDAEPEATAEVVELCGGLPLAIRIAASRFRRRPGWSVAYLADQLRDRQRRARTFTADELSVAGVIGLSYHHLTESRKKLFRLLGLVPGADVDAHAAAALAGTSVDEAADGLEELVECNLLMQRTSERYCLHDLVRDCARDLAAKAHTETELHDARHRLFDYFLHLADVRCRRITMSRPRFEPDLRHRPESLPDSSSEEEDIRQLRTEYQNMVAVANHAVANGWHAHAWQLPCLLMPYYTRVGYRSGVLDLSRNALRAAKDLGDRRGEAMALANIAFALREQGRHVEVQDVLEQAIGISREVGDLPAVVAGARDLGVARLQAGRLHEAAASFADARDVARVIGDLRAEVNSTIDLALVDCNLGRHDEAATSFHSALSLHQRDGCVEGEVVVLINLGWVGQLRDRDDEAVAPLERAVRLSRAIGMTRGEVMALAWLAVTYRRLGRLTEAIEVGQEALDAARRADLREPECDALNGLAETFLADGRVVEAESMLRQADRLAIDGDLPMVRARVQEGYAHLAVVEGQLDRARRYWERAVALYPADAGDADNARAHLEALGDRDVRCTRCKSAPHHPRRPAVARAVVPVR